uniref:Ribonuclease E n=1 Tax=Chondria tumulosa TaxID=2740715 RepID=A0A896SSW4_9FLOR|nr:ribonuclease E [Chondria tumulosa]QSD57033.1 ribonuclease E [Chondria tumulosa]
MVKKIIISYNNSIAAILKNNKIEQIIIVNNDYQVNDIYLGVVQRLFSSINAAFIELKKYGKSGFIHINDVRFLRRNKKFFHITDLLSVNQLVLVQVIKESTFNKGPRLTTNIHLHGKYIVLMPFCNTILISNRVYDKNERAYLYSLATLIKPTLMGLLVKLSAQGVSESVIIQDLDLLLRQWYFIQKVVLGNPRSSLVYKDEDLVKKVVRDFYDVSVKKVIVDSYYTLRLSYYYLKKWSCISSVVNTKLQLYKKQDCILNKFYVKRTIKAALRPKVKLYYGGYLIIENYEALTIIDVNSGSFNKPENSKETILKINLYAAIEIAYQLRIRNINGIVIIDFIDMYFQRDQLKLLEHFNKLLILDDARPQILQLSRLGLLELTRRRRGQSLKEVFYKSQVFNLYTFSSLYLNLFPSFSFKYAKDKLLINKNVCSLFFNKKFSNKKLIQSKHCSSDCLFYRKYFICIDYYYLVSLFIPKANYVIPLIFYFRLIKYQKFINSYFLLSKI